MIAYMPKRKFRINWGALCGLLLLIAGAAGTLACYVAFLTWVFQ